MQCFFIYYKIDNESPSSQCGVCDKVGSGFTLGTPENVSNVVFSALNGNPNCGT